MTDFRGHLRLGVIGGLFLAIAAVWVTLNRGYEIELALKTGGLGFGIVVLGSVFPDIDHHTSIPRRYLGYLFVLGSIGGVAFIIRDTPSLMTDVGALIVPTIGLPQSLIPGTGMATLVIPAMAFALLFGGFLDRLTTHRGFTHSVGFALVFGLVASGGLYSVVECCRILTATGDTRCLMGSLRTRR